MEKILEADFGLVDEPTNKTNNNKTVPKEKKQMDFYSALKLLKMGDKITRIEWPEGTYGFLKDDIVMIKTDTIHQWIISLGDLEATDWIIYN
jgi:hypothetical protein